MSSEVCPFCGKTYKRLKSHLPHCKAAATSKTPPTKDHVKPTQTPPSSQLVSEPAAKGKESTPAVSLKSANTSQSQSQSSLSSTSPPPSTKKKKQKLSEQIKMASSAPISLMSPPALSLSPTVSKPKRKSLRAVIEAATSDRVTKGSLEGTRSASGDLPSGPTPFLTDPLRSRTKAQSETSFIPDNASFSPLSRDTKPSDAPKKKVSETKRAAQPLPTTKDTDSKINESCPRASDRFWVDDTLEMEDLSGNQMILKSGGGHQARITIQDVKATLGRAKSSSESRRASILSQGETTDNISGKTELDTSAGPNQKDVVSCLITSKTLSDQLPGASSRPTKQQSAKRKSLKSKQASLIPVQHDVSSQPKPTSPATPLPSGHPASQVSRATPPPRAVSRSEGLTVGRHETKLLSISPSPIQFSSPHLFPPALRTLPARAETPRADDGLKLEDRKPNAAHSRTEGAATQRGLGQVRLRELPEWLACRAPGRPREVVAVVQRGWQWYYRRYIDVRKGGVGGLGMLLAGYCVLSYVWSYPHIKRDRWRKYH